MDRPYFPVAIDSTTIAAFRSCPQRAFRQYIEHWKPAEDSVHLIAGGAFAAGIEEARIAFYVEGMDAKTAGARGLRTLINKYGDFECPSDSAKSLERTAGALEFYLETYPLGEDGAIPVKFSDNRHGIEFSFAQPLPINHPVTGDPILYTGRSDMIAEAFNGIYIYDEKTTSSLGTSWAKQWDLRSQFTGYCWAAEQFGFKPSGVCVRGISILKTKYDTQQVLTYRSGFEIERWLDQTCRDIERMIKCWQDGYWDFNLDHACTEYGGCAFKSICKSADPDPWLKTYFVQRVWDPLAREELTLEEHNARMAEEMSNAPSS
jgi:hypothetical protein